MNKQLIQTMKILPIDLICPFEWNAFPTDTVEFEDIQHIRHPFLVTPLADGTYLLLEESAEFYTLLQAGIRLLPVQIIQKKQIQIYQKVIGLHSFDENDLGEILTGNSGQVLCQTVTSDTNEKDSVRLLMSEKKYLLNSIPTTREGCPTAVSKLFEYIEKNGGYRMINQKEELSESLMKIHQFAASIELPEVTIDDLMLAAQKNCLFPPSILKVGADVRILYIDFPVSTLIAENSSAEKEVFLRELILLREQAEKTSIYQGKVYLLNR